MDSPDFDRVFKRLKTFGNYQKFQLSLIALSWLNVATSSLGTVLIGYTPDHRCKTHATNSSGLSYNASLEVVPHGTCYLFNVTSNKTTSCLYGYTYKSKIHTTLTQEFDLVCDHDYLWQTSQTVYMFGQTVGSYIFTILSDRYGRRKSSINAFVLMIASGMVCAVVNDITSFSVMRFINGLCQMGFSTAAFVLAMEMFPTDARFLVGSVCIGITETVGHCLTPLINYLCKDLSWRYSLIFSNCIGIPLFLHICFLKESLRWLHANNDYQQAHNLLKHIARKNKVDMTELKQLMADCNFGITESCVITTEDAGHPTNNINERGEHGAECERMIVGSTIQHKAIVTNSKVVAKLRRIKSSNSNKQSINFWNILKNNRLRRHLLICGFIWSSNSFIYYSIVLMSNNLSGNNYLNLFLFSVVEFPAKLVLGFLMKHTPRRMSLAVILWACSAVMLAAAVLSEFDFSRAVTALCVIGKFFVSISFMMTWLYTPELYPTNARSVGVGSGSAFARFAGMASPFAGYLGVYVKWAPGALFAGIGAISGLLVILLPETKDTPLIHTIEDVELLYTQSPNLNDAGFVRENDFRKISEKT